MPAFPSFDVVDVVPGSDVATNGTLTFAYPSGLTAANYAQSAGAVMYAQQSGPLVQGTDFTIAYGASIVVTYLGSTAIKAGNRVRLQVPRTTYGDLTSAAGTASNAIPDVGASFSQSTLNNAFASLVAKINSLQALLRAHGIEPK